MTGHADADGLLTLPPDVVVCDCGRCGRLLLAGRYAGRPGFAWGPPVVSGWVRGRANPARLMPLCRDCEAVLVAPDPADAKPRREHLGEPLPVRVMADPRRRKRGRPELAGGERFEAAVRAMEDGLFPSAEPS